MVISINLYLVQYESSWNWKQFSLILNLFTSRNEMSLSLSINTYGGLTTLLSESIITMSTTAQKSVMAKAANWNALKKKESPGVQDKGQLMTNIFRAVATCDSQSQDFRSEGFTIYHGRLDMNSSKTDGKRCNHSWKRTEMPGWNLLKFRQASKQFYELMIEGLSLNKVI